VRKRRDRRKSRRKTGKERKVCGGEGGGEKAGTDSAGIKSTNRKDDG
jgi:hypothetical protein